MSSPSNALGEFDENIILDLVLVLTSLPDDITASAADTIVAEAEMMTTRTTFDAKAVAIAIAVVAAVRLVE